jgi:cell cycle checkpoint protein
MNTQATGPQGTDNNTSNKENVEFIFLAKIDNARVISSILQTLNTKKDQLATVTISKLGIKFTIEIAQSLQGSALLQQELFQEYNFTEGEAQKEQFQVNLSILLDCLNIYGISTTFPALQIAYKGYGHPLLLMLEENDVLTDCGIRTLDAEPLMNFNLRGAPIISKVIMNAESLKDAFGELDWNNTSVNWSISPNIPYFRLTTDGVGGSCQVDYPKDSEVFEVYECQQIQEFVYKMKILQPCIKALANAKKTLIRINQDGLLAFQHMIQAEDGATSFVDFYVVPLEGDDEEN